MVVFQVKLVLYNHWLCQQSGCSSLDKDTSLWHWPSSLPTFRNTHTRTHTFRVVMCVCECACSLMALKIKQWLYYHKCLRWRKVTWFKVGCDMCCLRGASYELMFVEPTLTSCLHPSAPFYVGVFDKKNWFVLVNVSHIVDTFEDWTWCTIVNS